MKRIVICVIISLSAVFTLAQVHFGNYVYEDKTADSRRAAIDAMIEAANRRQENQYRTYEDIYYIQRPESCTFESINEQTPNGIYTYYLVTIPELNATIQCSYPSFLRKRVTLVNVIRNGNGDIVKYGVAQ